jgi:hypothetical protein
MCVDYGIVAICLAKRIIMFYMEIVRHEICVLVKC